MINHMRYRVLVVAVVAAVLGAAPAWAQSPIHPENRPAGLAGETNGQVRPAALVGVEGSCRSGREAGPSLALMLATARADGVALVAGDCYRPAGAQSAAKSNACGKGNCACAAGSGTSMHGWGEAVDFRDAGGSLTFSSGGYAWLKRNGARYGWNHAGWAEPGGSACPEAWHWEWVGDGGKLAPKPAVVGISPTPTGAGYAIANAYGVVQPFGDAAYHGWANLAMLTSPATAAAPTPDGGGYWVATADGAVLTFGDAASHGAPAGQALGGRIVGL